MASEFANPILSALCLYHKMYDHLGNITKFQQNYKKTVRVWRPNSHPPLSKAGRVVRSMNEEGCTAATHIKHCSGGNLTL